MENNNLPVSVSSESMFFDIQKFEHCQRVAKVFSSSSMVPDHFRGAENTGNVMIALNLAARFEADPFMIMQNIYVVHGRPGIESKLAIALLNKSGKFSPLRFRYNDKKSECRAFARDLRTNEEIEGPPVSLEMAAKEGWSKAKKTKTGATIPSKWDTMPELMLMYRAAMFFVRKNAPEVLLGMQSIEEAEDIIDAKKTQSGSYEAIPEPVEVFAEGPSFEELVHQKTGDDYPNGLGDFLIATAEANKTTVDQLKARAIGNFDGFWNAYEAWSEKNKPVEPAEKPADDDFKMTAEYQIMTGSADMFPEFHKIALQQFGEPKSKEDCAKINKKINELVDSE